MRTLIQKRRDSLVGVVVGTVLATGFGAAAHADGELELDHGHVDTFNVSWVDDALTLNLKEDVTGSHVLHPAEDVLLKVKEEAKLTLPDPVPPGLSFLGQPGDEVYYLPQTQDPELVWPGWSTEGVPGGVFTNPMKIKVMDIEGPGDVFLWQNGAFGETVSVLDGGGYQLPGAIKVPAGSHVHANWGFTEPGRYEFTVEAEGTRITGGIAASNTATYAWQVGDPAATTTSLSVEGLEEHYHDGDAVSLNAVQNPQTELDDYRWFSREADETEWVEVEGAQTDEYNFAAEHERNGLQIVARLYDDSHELVAESTPVTVVVEDHDEEPVETALSVEGAASQYEVGDEASLTAVQNPPTDLDHYHWFTRAAGSDSWQIVAGAAGNSYGFTVTAQHDGMEVVAKLYDDHHEVVAESAPVTIEVATGTPPPADPVQKVLTDTVALVNSLLAGILGRG